MSNKPFVGQKATFYPAAPQGMAPMRAEVTHVWSDTCVNLQTENELGMLIGFAPTSVLVYDDAAGGAKPSGYYCVLDQVETMVQPKVTGYRQLSPEEVALMNEAKALAEQCGAFIERLRKHPSAPLVARGSGVAGGLAPLDQRWISLGATDLQRGFMAVVRGIAQPTSF